MGSKRRSFTEEYRGKVVAFRRSEAFAVVHFEGYIATSQVRAGLERFLQTTDSNCALVEDQSPLATALDEWLHWRSLGTDDGHVLLPCGSLMSKGDCQ
jgi:hypothetical protein